MTAAPEPIEVLVEAVGLGCARGGRELFRDIDLQVRAGESLAVAGPSGSGKTTLLTCLAGLTKPDAGAITVCGAPPRVAAGGQLATVLQGHALVTLLTAAENVEVAVRAAGRSGAEVKEVALAALADVGLADYADHLVEELSGGQQQRVAVARALVNSPRVVIADEPTTEQDKATRSILLAGLFEAVDRGGALVLATHDLGVAERCDRTLWLGRAPS